MSTGMPVPQDHALDGVSAADFQRLFAAASGARARAYAPYSRFAVGAALLDDQGRVHAGCNVENAAYPLGSCAEAGAVSALVAAGGRRIVAGLVLAMVDADPERPVTPCGGCRQRLREFSAGGVPFFFCTPQRHLLTRHMDQLLPDGFGPDHLKP